LKIGQQLRLPVALCVSKLDLMVNQLYADMDGDGVISKFYKDLAEIGWELNLESIEARHQELAKLHQTVWPGWSIERQIGDLFGGRHKFFPLTPVGLNGLGVEDLTQRVIAPVGLLEPLLWLLHMNGFRVFV
jgi:hypothetical protein